MTAPPPPTLRPVLDAPNLRVVTGAAARRCCWRAPAAWGGAVGALRRLHTARAGSEVVVSAGGPSYLSRLLLLSGDGLAPELAGPGIDVVLDLPGVGRNLHDHLLSPSDPRRRSRPSTPPAPGQLLDPPAAAGGAAARTCRGPHTQPVHFSVPLYEPWMQGPPNGFTLMGGMVRPQSRGSSPPPPPPRHDPLLIDLGAFEAPRSESLEASLAQGARDRGGALATRRVGRLRLHPGLRSARRPSYGIMCARTAITYHHQVGTCRMGVDPCAVSSTPACACTGSDGLARCPCIGHAWLLFTPSGNTNAPTLMIGERAADFIATRSQSAAQASLAAPAPERTHAHLQPCGRVPAEPSPPVACHGPRSGPRTPAFPCTPRLVVRIETSASPQAHVVLRSPLAARAHFML